MRKATVVFLTVFCFTMILAGVASAADKFAYVDLSRVFNDYKKTKDFDKVLADKESAYETERNKKVADIKQYQDKMNLLSDKEKEAKRGDLETKIKILQEGDRQKQVDLRKEFNEKRAEVLKDIDNTIKQLAEKGGYTLVFNEAGVLYNAKNLDITDEVLNALNKGYKK
ncbi:MAG: OmpH family outer membrane protein [Candidatus Omnitrophica bacterium]|nr:OmpH family outer membrane protein [Candidatus Omnitrophota bacterium]